MSNVEITKCSNIGAINLTDANKHIIELNHIPRPTITIGLTLPSGGASSSIDLYNYKYLGGM